MIRVGVVARAQALPPEFGRRFELEELRDDRLGLRILLRSTNNRLMWLRFGQAIAYRSYDEGAYPEMSGMLGRAASGLVVLESSSWADEYIEFGSGLLSRARFTHWAVGASNQIAEALVFDDPRIELLP